MVDASETAKDIPAETDKSRVFIWDKAAVIPRFATNVINSDFTIEMEGEAESAAAKVMTWEAIFETAAAKERPTAMLIVTMAIADKEAMSPKEAARVRT